MKSTTIRVSSKSKKDKEALKKDFENIVAPIRERVKVKGISRNDLERVIKEVREPQ